ncbi:Atu4866 domain-containing protein [Bosea sp. BIWAKO-01]|uniref:Atu4866 domain-containing protein n=1 Tax=Bosea sp. BIWAKO-01 TaxID=506668 RepID=UPI000942C51D|nr:Atu4866 domain-containing protein [Bosea sp. BIWAKO-01]
MRARSITVATGLVVALAGAALAEKPMMQATHPFVGMWVTDDNRIRHELLPDGRYVEARGNREGAYRGRYEVTGRHIEYWDDTGFTADGDFADADTLHHAGMVLRRRDRPSSATVP